MRRGFRLLGLSTEAVPEYLYTVTAVRRSWADANKDAIVRYVRALSSAFKFIRDPAKRDRIAGRGEDNRNLCVRGFCGQRRRRAGCGDDGHLTANQFRSKLRQAFVVVFSPAILDDDVLTFDKAHLIKPASEFTQEFRVELRCRAIEKTDDGH